MSISEIIRNKRKELGLTQEQVAQYLGVSTPAVNKWEKDYSYPDITLLAPLARLLNTDLNTLLCFKESLTNEEISNYLNEIVLTIKNENFENGFNKAMERIKEYPHCDKLLHDSATILEGAFILHGGELEDKAYFENQIYSLYERTVNSTDPEIRNSSIYMLISKYMRVNETQKAWDMLELLPERTSPDKKKLKADLLIKEDKLKEAGEILERRLIMTLNEILIVFMSLTEVALKEHRNQDAHYIAETYKRMVSLFDLWDYNSHVIELQVLTSEEDAEGCISILNKLFTSVGTPWDMTNSPLYTHIAPTKEQKKNLDPYMGSKMITALIKELKTNEKYEFLRTYKGYDELINKYSENLRNP